MEKGKHICGYCDRRYERKVYYDRHVIACELMSKSKKERDIASQEHDDTPTVRKLYDMVLEMGKMMASMEKRMIEMEKWANTKKKKVNIIDWLNTNYSPKISWEEWRDSIQIHETYLDTLLDDDMMTVFSQIFQDNICENDEVTPICGFDKGHRVLYAYSKEGWAKLDCDTTHKLMHSIYRKLISALIEWDKKNIECCENEHQRERKEEQYILYMKKCTSSKQSSSQRYQRMTNILHKLVVMRLTDVVEVEFSL